MDSAELRKISPEELERVLRDQDLYVDTGTRSGKRADLSRADLRGLDLRNRRLMLVNLQGANLVGADLTGAYVGGANVAGADLCGAIVRPDQVMSMQSWLLALWNHDILAALGLPPDHNERAAARNFSSYNLEGRDLRACDLTDVNLQGANLRRAKFEGLDLQRTDLTGADVYHAHFQQTKVLPHQAKLVKNWIHARWSPEVLVALGLPPGHNDFLGDNGQNFSSYELRDRDFKGSDFTRTLLQGTDVAGSDFRDAITPVGTALATKNWLLARWPADILQAIGLPPDHNERVAQRSFQNYNLEGRDLTGFDLSSANLRGASLNYVVFANTDLHGTVLTNCVLHNVDLKTARGLRAYQLLGADLTGATLLGAIEESLKSLPGVDESSKNSRKLFLTMLIACLYCWLTILSTTDAAILLGSSSLALPIVQTPIPVVAFFLAAPFLILVVYIYLHFSLQSLWESLATLPAIFPDGRPLHERAYPWFMSSLVRTRFPILAKDTPLLPRFQVFCARILAWWIVPFTLLAFWLRFLVRHSWIFIAFHIILISLSVLLASWFWAIAVATLEGKPPVRIAWYRTILERRSLATYLPAISVGLLAVWGSANALSGEHWSAKARREPGPAMERILRTIGWSPFANLQGANLSPKPPNWPVGDWHEVKGGKLSGVVLRQVEARGAFAINADLSFADLYESFFNFADLRAANLRGSKLSKTYFVNADLRDADLTGADITLTNFAGANLQGARFDASSPSIVQLWGSRNWLLDYFDHPEELRLPSDHNDRVRRKDFSGYNFARFLAVDFQDADLSNANLQRAILATASLDKSNLSGADLRGANVRGVSLSEANLLKADLRGLDLSEVQGLTLAQISSAITDKSTRLPDYLQRQIAFGHTDSPGTRAATHSH